MLTIPWERRKKYHDGLFHVRRHHPSNNPEIIEYSTCELNAVIVYFPLCLGEKFEELQFEPLEALRMSPCKCAVKLQWKGEVNWRAARHQSL